MRITYLIIAHRYPEQLLRLVGVLDRESVSFLIHIDRKASDEVHRRVREGLIGCRNVRFLEPVTCHWGDFGMVRASLRGLAAAIEADPPFDYLVLLTGQDYPIKSNDSIDRFLREREGSSFVHHNPFPYSEWKADHGGWDRIRFWHIRKERRHFVFPGRAAFRSRLLNRAWRAASVVFPLRRRFPAGFHPYGGAHPWILHRRHALRIHRFVRENRAFVRFFRFVTFPDEIMLQTIVGNRIDSSELHNDTMHYVEWSRPGAVLLESDFDTLRSTDYLFARKFDATVDSRILDRIDRELLAPDAR